jgi:hypothetical protein
MGKSKAHQRYRTADDTIVPGVTTITGVMNKPALVNWANNLGLKGISVGKYVDDLADVGTLAHKIIECYLTKQEVDYADYTPNQKSLAENAVLKFFSWEKENKFEVIKSELQMVSEKHRFGGCCDIYANLNGKSTLIDLKTSKGIFGEHFTQVSAYALLLEENGYPVEDVRILRIGRDESEGFDDKSVPLLKVHQERFLACLKLYNLNKQLKEV